MTKIKTTKVSGQTYYSAADLYNNIGVSYRGFDTLYRDGAQGLTANFNSRYQYVVNEKELTKICKKYGTKPYAVGVGSIKTPPASFTYKPSSRVNTGTVKGLQHSTSDLQVLTQQLHAKPALATISLQNKPNLAKVRQANPLQVEARKQIRELVQDYADKEVKKLKITDADSKALFFDLGYNALYNAYRLYTGKKIDLKALADAETQKTGKKVSGLIVAEKLGIAIDLLKFTQQFYR